MKIDGACHCGRISFTAEIDPAGVMVCHCTDCQTLSGGPFRMLVLAPIETFSVNGTPAVYVKSAESGNRRAQMFCPECGSNLYACAPDKPTMVSIRLGSVRQRAELVPHAQIWRRSALPWVDDLHDVPGSPRQEALLLPSGRRL